MKRVIVPVDGSEFALRILPDAQRLAGAGGEIILVRDVDRLRDPFVGDSLRQNEIREANAYLDTMVLDLHGKGIQVRALTLALDDVALSIDEAARVLNADFIACATHGHGPAGRLMRGGVAWKVLTHSPVPVLLRHAHEDSRPEDTQFLPPRRILVPLDGSPPAERALPLARELAKEWGAPMWLTTVIPIMAPDMRFGISDGEVRHLVAESQLYLDRLADTLPVETHTHVFAGTIVPELVQATRLWSITDVVMVTHGRTGFSRVVLGSVADALVQSLLLPIILVPAASLVSDAAPLPTKEVSAV
jgi:nucleotide-binding universal stress UspA family protein